MKTTKYYNSKNKEVDPCFLDKKAVKQIISELENSDKVIGFINDIEVSANNYLENLNKSYGKKIRVLNFLEKKEANTETLEKQIKSINEKIENMNESLENGWINTIISWCYDKIDDLEGLEDLED